MIRATTPLVAYLLCDFLFIHDCFFDFKYAPHDYLKLWWIPGDGRLENIPPYCYLDKDTNVIPLSSNYDKPFKHTKDVGGVFLNVLCILDTLRLCYYSSYFNNILYDYLNGN